MSRWCDAPHGVPSAARCQVIPVGVFPSLGLTTLVQRRRRSLPQPSGRGVRRGGDGGRLGVVPPASSSAIQGRGPAPDASSRDAARHGVPRATGKPAPFPLDPVLWKRSRDPRGGASFPGEFPLVLPPCPIFRRCGVEADLVEVNQLWPLIIYFAVVLAVVGSMLAIRRFLAQRRLEKPPRSLSNPASCRWATPTSGSRRRLLLEPTQKPGAHLLAVRVSRPAPHSAPFLIVLARVDKVPRWAHPLPQ